MGELNRAEAASPCSRTRVRRDVEPVRAMSVLPEGGRNRPDSTGTSSAFRSQLLPVVAEFCVRNRVGYDLSAGGIRLAVTPRGTVPTHEGSRANEETA